MKPDTLSAMEAGTPKELVTEAMLRPLRRFAESWSATLEKCANQIDGESLTSLLNEADRLASDSASMIADVLARFGGGTDHAMLVRLVRRRCFDAADSVLHDCILQLEQTSSTPQPVTGVLAGFLKDRPGGPNDKPKKFRLPQGAKTYILIRLLSYLNAIAEAPDYLAEYGQASLGQADLFGGGLGEVTQAYRGVVDTLKLRIEDLKAVREKRWEAQVVEQTEVLDRVSEFVSAQETKRTRGFASLVAAAVFAAPGYYLVMMPTGNAVLGGLAGVSVVTSMVFGYRALGKLMSSTG